MADLRRLGKRGSYRLGRLGSPPGRPRTPAARSPSFTPAHRGPTSAWLAACATAAAGIAAGALAGLWFLPFLAGLGAGLAARWGRWRARVTVPAVVVMAATGWGAALAWLTWRGLPEGAVARVIAALAGLPAHRELTIAATVLVAVMQASAGLWLGRALLPGRGTR